MDEQDKGQKIPEAESTEPAERQEDQLEKIKETTEKLWGSTRQAFNTATFKANQYKKLVQKKIDLSALHKKIGVTHSELGKLIDDLREAGKKSIMSQEAVKTILNRLDELKAEAAALEEELEQIRTEEVSQEVPPEVLPPEEKTE
jgi:DNA repair ATPase RecN